MSTKVKGEMLESPLILTGPLEFDGPNANGVIRVITDPLASSGEVLQVGGDVGLEHKAPFIVLDTQNPQLTMGGAVVGAPIIATAVDSFGVVSLGYGAVPTSDYTVEVFNPNVVVIKAANSVPPTAWIDLGLTVTLTEDIPAGKGLLIFEIILANPTTRNGVVEWGLSVNGGTPLVREVKTQVNANFNQTIGMSVPISNAYSAGDTLSLRAQVISNDNNQFSLSTGSTAQNPASFAVFLSGGSSSSPNILNIQDGIAAPAAIVGRALLYVDIADGDLKVKFGDGTVKTITTNP